MAISLLTSCTQQRHLRSDIKEFIASFSLASAHEVYKECSFVRVDTETIGSTVVEVTATKSINVKDPNNLVYDYTEITTENGEVKQSLHNYLEKNDENYFYVSGGTKVQKTPAEALEITNSFFYTSSSEGIYIGGMYAGDTMLDIIFDIQDNVTIDSENKLLVYSYEKVMKEGNVTVTINQDYKVNNLGMVVSNYIHKESSQSTFNSVLTVTNK